MARTTCLKRLPAQELVGPTAAGTFQFGAAERGSASDYYDFAGAPKLHCLSVLACNHHDIVSWILEPAQNCADCKASFPAIPGISPYMSCCTDHIWGRDPAFITRLPAPLSLRSGSLPCTRPKKASDKIKERTRFLGADDVCELRSETQTHTGCEKPIGIDLMKQQLVCNIAIVKPAKRNVMSLLKPYTDADQAGAAGPFGC